MLSLMLFALSAFVALLVAACCVQDLVCEALAPRLTPDESPPATHPLVSVLIPARNEVTRIGPCMTGLASQSYAAVEVLVVDDDSSDGTADLVRGFAGRLPALMVMRGAPLPPGWAGKCWACWQAAQRAHGEWLLFLDADVAPYPELIRALVARAEHSEVDLITLMPLLRLGSWAERLVLPAFMTILYALYPLHRVSAPDSPVAFANGQCIFIRRKVYEALGGHRAVAAEVLEDAIFGQRVKAAGYKVLAAAARDLIEVRMYTGWTSLAEGLSKHAVAGYRNAGWRATWVGSRQALIAFTPWYLLLAGALAWAASPGAPFAAALLLQGGGLALLTLACAAWLAARRYQLGIVWGMLYPLGLAIYFGLAARAFLSVYSGRGVPWKGRVFHS